MAGGGDGAHELLEALRTPTRDLRRAAPEPWAGFSHLHDAALAPGVLATRTKELMALAIAVVKQCDGCVAYHARAAAHHGASAQEVAETLSVALLMDGGTATVYGPRAWEAFCEFADARAAAAAQAVEGSASSANGASHGDVRPW